MEEEELTTKRMGWREFVYRLFFTREDSLDILQVLFSLIVLVSLLACWRLVSIGTPPEVVKESLITLRWMMGLLVVTAVPKWLVPAFTTKKSDSINTTE